MVAATAVKAKVSLDRTGWVTVTASPQWWRATADDPQWPELAQYLARQGEESRATDLCGVVGRTTGRPCCSSAQPR